MNEPNARGEQFCPRCGKDNASDARFCSQCAFDLSTTQSKSEPHASEAIGPDFELHQTSRSNYIPIIVGGVAIVLLIGLLGLFGFLRVGNSSTAIDVNSSETTLPSQKKSTATTPNPADIDYSPTDVADGDNPDGLSGIEAEAVNEAKKYWENRFKRCGDSHYHHFLSPFHEMSRTPAYEVFAELKDLSWETDGEVPEAKTTAERLNQRDNPSGVAWQGKTEAFISARRIWRSDEGGVWQRWEDKSGPLETFKMIKRNGKWEFNGQNWYNAWYQVRPVICNEIPK